MTSSMALVKVLVVLVALLARASAAVSSPVVLLRQGAIRGITTSTGVSKFLGVPFAEPPLRWRAPVPKAPWRGIRDALKSGNECPQMDSLYRKVEKDGTSEDCLFLDVYAPSTLSATRQCLPVMLFIHGGCFQTGAASGYDGSSWAARGLAVSVNIQYRLGVFGFLGSNTMRSRTTDGSTGNFGIQDQRLAMQWVKENIDAFGGCSDKVYIFGESAGAASVSNHLARPQSTGLYSSAGMESGGFAPWSAKSLADAELGFRHIVAGANCSTFSNPMPCLEQVGTDALVLLSNSTPSNEWGCLWKPVIDGVELKAHPANLLSNGEVNRVPTIIGSNHDEGAIFAVQFPRNAVFTDIYAALAKYPFLLDESEARKAVELYTKIWGTSVKDTWSIAQHILGDVMFSCPSRRAARQLASLSSSFLYFFAAEPIVPCLGKSIHGCELPFVFNMNKYLWGTSERNLATQMSARWANFAGQGIPGTGWPAVDATINKGINNFVFELLKSYNATTFKEEVCSFWDAHPRSVTI